MYILIDLNQMAITHKHRDRAVLNKLSWIECSNASSIIAVGSVRPLLEFTASELRLLYKAATGAELKGYANALAQAVCDAAKRMPETVATLEDATAQALCVMDGDKACFRFVAGSKKPEHLPGLFEPDPIKVDRVEAEEQAVASNYSTYAPANPGAFGGTGPAVAGCAGVVATREPRAPSAPRTGGARETIFSVADRMWEAAGSPTNASVILALRKNIMVELEANHGVKKTTSSTALGDWQKSKLS